MTIVLYTAKQSSQIMRIRPKPLLSVHRRADLLQTDGIARFVFDPTKYKLSASTAYPQSTWASGPYNASFLLSQRRFPRKIINVTSSDLGFFQATGDAEETLIPSRF